MVKTLPFQCSGTASISGQETKISHGVQCSSSKKKKKIYIYIYIYIHTHTHIYTHTHTHTQNISITPQIPTCPFRSTLPSHTQLLKTLICLPSDGFTFSVCRVNGPRSLTCVPLTWHHTSASPECMPCFSLWRNTPLHE